LGGGKAAQPGTAAKTIDPSSDLRFISFPLALALLCRGSTPRGRTILPKGVTVCAAPSGFLLAEAANARTESDAYAMPK
jgi:hypothetical protein